MALSGELAERKATAETGQPTWWWCHVNEGIFLSKFY